MFGWIYQKYANSFDEMKNLPKDLLNELNEKYELKALRQVKVENSLDGTRKYLFETNDGLTVEAVLLLMREEVVGEDGVIEKGAKYTICISSQVGCKMGCSFCYTTKGGFKRNLTSGEIVSQVLEIKKDNNIPANKAVNIVYMGMGEPLDNLENLLKAIEVFKDEEGLMISPRRQTVSTSGLADKIKLLAQAKTGVLLAISLHAVDDETRSTLMPVNKKYNIKEVLDVVREFPVDERKKILFEYLVMKDVNDSLDSAKKLIKLLDGIKAKVNLILFNSHPGSKFERPTNESVVEFQEYLLSKGIICTIRQSKGQDISAACGQLKEKTQEERL